MSKCKWCGVECEGETCSAECAAVYAKFQAHPENYPARTIEPATLIVFPGDEDAAKEILASTGAEE